MKPQTKVPVYPARSAILVIVNKSKKTHAKLVGLLFFLSVLCVPL
jgi:hypothetical protein